MLHENFFAVTRPWTYKTIVAARNVYTNAKINKFIE